MTELKCNNCKEDISDYWKFVKMDVVSNESFADYGSDNTGSIQYKFNCPYCNHNIRITRNFKFVDENLED